MSDADTSIALAKLSYKQAVAVAMVTAAAAVITTVIGSAEVRKALIDSAVTQKPRAGEQNSPQARPSSVKDNPANIDAPTTIHNDLLASGALVRQQSEGQDRVSSGEVDSLRNSKLDLERQLAAAIFERDQARSEIDAATTTITQLESAKKTAEEAAASIAAELDGAHGQLAESQTTLAAMRKDNDNLRIQLKARTVKIEDRPSLYSAFSTADLSASECLSRSEQITTQLGGSVTQKDMNALFLSNGRYTWGVQCIASSRLISVVIAGPDLDVARRWGDRFRADFLAAGH